MDVLGTPSGPWQSPARCSSAVVHPGERYVCSTTGKASCEVGAAKPKYTIARRAFVAGNSLWRPGQNVEVDLD